MEAVFLVADRRVLWGRAARIVIDDRGNLTGTSSSQSVFPALGHRCIGGHRGRRRGRPADYRRLDWTGLFVASKYTKTSGFLLGLFCLLLIQELVLYNGLHIILSEMHGNETVKNDRTNNE